MSLTIPLSDLKDGAPTRVDLDGRAVCLVRLGGTVHAVDDTCTHAEVSLSEGEVDGATIECWLHGSRFDLATGRPSGPPALTPIAVHRATLTDDGTAVTVELTSDQTDERNRA
jgi:3-phenylpropionate/trans-cinnamate dioxygenase ferredoxin subunit